MCDKQTLLNGFRYCIRVLRDNECITGEKALRNLSYLLTLKLIEPHIGRDINIEGYTYDFSHIDDAYVEQHRSKLFDIVRFSRLAEEKDANIATNMSYLWDDILCVHPATRNVFVRGKSFDMQHTSTYRKLISRIQELTLEQCEYDILGAAYEEVIQDIMTVKVLGQFFTQPLVKRMMVRLIDPQTFADGTIETVCDPAMGTGGFLITYLRHVIAQAAERGVSIDWDYVRNHGVYGKEIDPDTYHLAVSNMLISSGRIFDRIECGDSIRAPISRTFDHVLANPPFGIKGLRYDEIHSEHKQTYVPIRTDNAVALFLQAIIAMLKVGGTCAVVLPDGQELFSKTNKIFRTVREYLFRTCEVREIIYLPAGVFTYTTIRTCVMYFSKKRDPHSVLDVKIKMSKTLKETGRVYQFTNTHESSRVRFCEYNPDTDTKTDIADVCIEDIVKNAYAINVMHYCSHPVSSPSTACVQSLGDICDFLPKSKRKAAYGKREGAYPFFTSSARVDRFVDTPDYTEECIIIGTGGTANVKYSAAFSCSADNFVVRTRGGVLAKYVYYYLRTHIEVLQKGFVGVGLQHVSKEFVCSVSVPVCPLEVQRQIINDCDADDARIACLERDIEHTRAQTRKHLDAHLTL